MKITEKFRVPNHTESPSIKKTQVQAKKKLHNLSGFGDLSVEEAFLKWASYQRTFGLLRFIIPEEIKVKDLHSKMVELCEKHSDLGFKVWSAQTWDGNAKVNHIYLVKENPSNPKKSSYCKSYLHDKCENCECYCHYFVKTIRKREQIMAEIKQKEMDAKLSKAYEWHKLKYQSLIDSVRSLKEKNPEIGITSIIPQNKEEWAVFISASLEGKEIGKIDRDNAIYFGPFKFSQGLNHRIYAAINYLNERNKIRDIPFLYGIEDTIDPETLDKYVMIYKRAI